MLQTHVVAVNPSLYSLQNLNLFRLNNPQFSLEDWEVFELKGNDVERYLHGQLTNDVKAMPKNSAQINSRLDKNGRLVGFLYLLKSETISYCLVHKTLSETIIPDIEKFIIMDDIEIVSSDKKMYFEAGVSDSGFKGHYLGELGTFQFGSSKNKTSDEVSKLLRVLNGYPEWNSNSSPEQLVNETPLNELSVSYEKGCFLGQETAAKIETRRGASRSIVLVDFGEAENFAPLEKILHKGKEVGEIVSTISLEDGIICECKLKREFIISDREFEFSVNNSNYYAKIKIPPLLGMKSEQDYSVECFKIAGELFNKNEDEEALEYFKKSIQYDPSFADAYESLGVLAGRLGKFEEGIEAMDDLLKVNPDSVMAHSNKSLFFMKLGKIEEAENEKAEATVKGFMAQGKIIQKEKILEEEKKARENDFLRRESMYKQVIEVDPADEMALTGLAEISFYRKDFSSSISYCEKVLEVNEKYSQAYLVMAKSLRELGNNLKAIEICEKGILVASNKGEMKPANEMQGLIIKMKESL